MLFHITFNLQTFKPANRQISGVIFEIYPKRNNEDITTNVRIGFTIDNLNEILMNLAPFKPKIISKPKQSPWGKRTIIDDPEGHRIELIEKTEQEHSCT